MNVKLAILFFSLEIYFFSLLIAVISGKDEFTQVLSCTGTDMFLARKSLKRIEFLILCRILRDF